jgi:16S rRNA (cytidine1402-2'-O)-methyltransferase
MSGTLFVVATPIGNLEDISGRALRVLREVSVIAAEDTRRTAQLLARYAITTSTTSLHAHNETKKTRALVERLRAGDSIALVSDAGTPTVSDPGAVLIAAAIDADISIEPIPGPSALLALLAVSGLPADSFAFLGFPPTRSNDRNSWFAELGEQKKTVIFYEAPHRLVPTLERIQRDYGECHIVLGRELTKSHEEIVRGPIGQVLSTIGKPRGEYCLAINLSETGATRHTLSITDGEIAHEFWLTTNNDRLTRRRAISAVARKLGLPPNSVYEAIERHKNSVE